MQRILVCLSVFALWTCSGSTVAPDQEPSQVLDIATGAMSYETGAHGDVVVRNKSTDTVLYNLCSRELQRWSGSEWAVFVAQPTDGFCIQNLLWLAPGEADTGGLEIPSDAVSGQYRLHFLGLYDEDMAPLQLHDRVSNTFDVAP